MGLTHYPCGHENKGCVDCNTAALRTEIERLRVLAVHDAELYHNQNHMADFRHCGVVVCQERRVVLREIREARTALAKPKGGREGGWKILRSRPLPPDHKGGEAMTPRVTLAAIRGAIAGALAVVIGYGLHEVGATPLLAAGVAALVYVVLGLGRELFLDRS